MRTITLELTNTAMLDNTEPMLSLDDFIFQIKSSKYKIKQIVVTARNGEKVKKISLDKDYVIDLKELAIAGELEIEISAVISGRVVKTWRVPSIIIVEIGHTFQAIPEIEALKQQFKTETDKLKVAIKELNEKIEKQGV